MEQVNVERWIDLDSDEFKKIEHHAWIKRFTLRAIEVGAVTVDKAGYIWHDKTPVHAELGDEKVGLRYAAKAVN